MPDEKAAIPIENTEQTTKPVDKSLEENITELDTKITENLASATPEQLRAWANQITELEELVKKGTNDNLTNSFLSSFGVPKNKNIEPDESKPDPFKLYMGKKSEKYSVSLEMLNELKGIVQFQLNEGKTKETLDKELNALCDEITKKLKSAKPEQLEGWENQISRQIQVRRAFIECQTRILEKNCNPPNTKLDDATLKLNLEKQESCQSQSSYIGKLHALKTKIIKRKTLVEQGTQKVAAPAVQHSLPKRR